MDDVEEDRQRALSELLNDRDGTMESLLEAFGPGTYGCHEALHLASHLAQQCGLGLAEHPAIVLNEEWYRKVSQIVADLHDLYQDIGRKHL